MCNIGLLERSGRVTKSHHAQAVFSKASAANELLTLILPQPLPRKLPENPCQPYNNGKNQRVQSSGFRGDPSPMDSFPLRPRLPGGRSPLQVAADEGTKPYVQDIPDNYSLNKNQVSAKGDKPAEQLLNNKNTCMNL